MKIIIKVDNDKDDDSFITLTDEELDNPNYIDLKLSDDICTLQSVTVSVEDLYRAAGLFNDIRLVHKADQIDE